MEREQSKLRKLLRDYQKAEQLQIQDRIDRCTLSEASWIFEMPEQTISSNFLQRFSTDSFFFL